MPCNREPEWRDGAVDDTRTLGAVWGNGAAGSTSSSSGWPQLPCTWYEASLSPIIPGGSGERRQSFIVASLLCLFGEIRLSL